MTRTKTYSFYRVDIFKECFILNNYSIIHLSVLQEKSFGKLQYRAILWTKFGPKRLQFCGNGKTVTIKHVSGF